jgi:hypothetical protein
MTTQKQTAILTGLLLTALAAAYPAQGASDASLNTSVSGNGSGVIASGPPGINCPTDCNHGYKLKTLVTLFAAPAPGSRFKEWTGACKAVKAATCIVKINSNRTASAAFAKSSTQHTAVKALLLLHGMNAGFESWNELARLRFRNNCPRVVAGAIIGADSKNPNNNVLCYRLNAGMYDFVSGRKGLEKLTPAGGRTSGDFSSFAQLGLEVRAAVRGILNRHPKAKIVLLAHSRGGLAARAFLQQGSSERQAVIGLLTTGSPHKGSHLGRIYQYLKNHPCRPRDICDGKNEEDDWAVVDFLRKGLVTEFAEANLDVRKPTIGDLADNSTAIKTLNADIIHLPVQLAYGALLYAGSRMGDLATSLFTTCSIFEDDLFCPDVSKSAQAFMLGNQSPGFLTGDGIVARTHQRYFDITGFPRAVKTKVALTGEAETLHTSETEQEADLNKLLTQTMGKWWTRKTVSAAAPDEPLSAPAEATPQGPISEEWGHWLRLWQDREYAQLALASATLAERLQQSGDETVYRDLRQRLQQPGISWQRRVWLIDLLADTATPPALEILLEAITRERHPAPRDKLLEAITRTGDNRWQGRFHPELSPALESAWRDAHDPGLITALATAIAKIGAPSGLEQLFAALSGDGKTLAEISRSPDPRGHAAINAISKVRNPEALPVLTAWFNRSRAGEPAFIASGEALANLGSPEATAFLANWAKRAPISARPLVKRWLKGARDTDSRELLRDIPALP